MSYPDFILLQKKLEASCGAQCVNVTKENESEEYSALTFTFNDKQIKFRSAKITPAKTGQFVTLWKRNENNITVPHNDSDPYAFYIISIQKEELSGCFVFSKQCLIEHGILSAAKKEGKRGFRVYSPWDTVDNKQARETQKWQTHYFEDFNDSAVGRENFAHLLVY